MLTAEYITFNYRHGQPALNDISVRLEPGQVLGLVASSGFRKSTLGKIMTGWINRFRGIVALDGEPLQAHQPCRVQYINQNPEVSVNPRQRMGRIPTECWSVDEDTKHQPGIEDVWLGCFPSKLSGGELQRLCIARVLHPELRYLIADEMTTMLDPLTQAQIWTELAGLTREKGIGLLMITHNPALVSRLCDGAIYLDRLNP